MERALRGPVAGMSIGTTLGALFGLVPALAILTRVNVILARWFVAVLLAPLAAGFLVGGLLDRCFEALARRTVGDEGGDTRPET
jgi:hypothetical protein